MGWEYGPGGYRVWIDPETGKEGTPPPKLEAKRNRAEDKETKRRKKVNKRAARTREESDKRARDRAKAQAQPKPEGSKANVKPAPPAESPAQEKARLAAAEKQAAKQAKQAAKRAAEAALRKRIQAKAEKRGKRFAQQLKVRQKAIDAQRRANEAEVRALNQSLSAASRNGDAELAKSLANTRMSLLQQNEYLTKKYDDNQAGYNRIKAGNKFRQRIDDLRANDALTDVQKRRRLRNLRNERQGEKRAAIKASSIPSVAKAVYGQKRPGDNGYGKVLKKAIKDLTSRQIADPDNFDPETLNLLGNRLVKHEKRIAAQYDKFATGYEADIAILDPESKTAAKPGSQKWNRARNRMLRRFEEYNLEDARREFRFLYGPKSKTNIKGTKIPKPHKKGLFNYFAASADAAFDSAERRAREILFGVGLPGLIKEQAYKVQTAAYFAVAEGSRRQIEDPPGSGNYRKQTQQERLNEMFRQGQMSQQEAQELGQQQVRDFAEEAKAVQDSPTLPHMFDLFEAEGIKSSADLTGTFDIEKLESRLLPRAIDSFWEEWKASDNYAIPGEAEGIFDASRYGQDENGEFFLLADGTKVRVGDPLPEGHPTPHWGHSEDVGLSTHVARGISWAFAPVGLALTATGNEINISDTYSRAYDHAMASYEEKMRQRAEDDMRAALRIEDPGFLGDIFRHNAAGEILSYFDAVPGNVALAWNNYNQALTGLNRPEGFDEPIKNSKDFVNYIKANGEKYSGDEYYLDAHTSDQADPVGRLFTALGLTASKAVSIDPESDRATISILISLPILGPTEFVWEVGEEADKTLAEANEQAEEALQHFLKTGDFGVYARVMGTNEIYQFGNLAGLANFVHYLLVDPSNFIPGITLGKKGLSAVRGAMAAGKAVPPGTGKLARLVEGFRGAKAGFFTDVKSAEVVTRMVKDFEGLMPGASREDIIAALSRARAGIDDTVPKETQIEQLGKALEKEFGLSRLGLDTKQVHQLAEQEAYAILTKMDWSVYTQADEAAAHVTKMEQSLNLVNAEARALDDQRMLANDRVVEILSQEGRQARMDAARVRQASEAFDSTALDLANRHSLSSLQRMARNARTAQARRLYAAAADLKFKRAAPAPRVTPAAIRPRPPRKVVKGAERKRLRDAELRQEALDARQSRARAAAEKKYQREVAREAEKVQRVAEARGGGVVDRLSAVADFADGKFRRAIPASWSQADGPRFWNSMAGPLRSPKGPREALKDAMGMVEGIHARYGRWSMEDVGTRAFMERVAGVSDILSPQEMGDELLRLLRNPDGLDNRELATIFLARQQFFAGTSDEAITFLKAVGSDGNYDVFIRQMFANDLNDFRMWSQDIALDIRQSFLEDMPLARLDEFLNPPLRQNEELFALGGFAMRPGAPVVGFGGLDIDAALRNLSEAIGSANDLSPTQARQLDTLVRAALYQSVTAKDWELLQTLSQTLSRAGNRTKAGRLARAIRQRMFRELEILGIDESVLRAAPADGSILTGPPRPQEVAIKQAQALMNEMGMSEEAWLRNRIKHNDGVRNNPRTTAASASRLSRENDLMTRALEDIRVQKAGGTYKPPAMSFDEAVRGAEAMRGRVAGRTPPKIFAFFARNAEQAEVETYRAVYQASRETPTNGQTVNVIEDFLQQFDMKNYDEVHEAVTARIQEVQGRRRAKLGERKPAFEEEPNADDFLHSLNDKDPEILAAKRQALQEMSDKYGVEISVAMYDRMRTLLNGHIQRGVRARAIADEAGAMAGDFDRNFLELRMAKTDEDAVQSIRQMLLRHPGMTPEMAARQFELSYIQDGILRKPRKKVTDSDIHIMERYFEAKSGADLSNQKSVVRALGRADTKPNFKSRQLFRTEAVRKGDWAPRKAEDIDPSRPTWSLDEEREFFMNRYGEAPPWTTAPALQHGGDAFLSREVMYRTMLSTGNYDETVRLQRALGEVEYTNLDELAFGRKGPDGEWVVRPAKDIERERLWMVQRYGDRVGQINADGSVTLTAAPWLMNKAELQQFMRNIPDTKTGLLGDLITNAEELDDFTRAIDRVTEKHVKSWVRATGIENPNGLVIPSAVLHRIAFDVVQEISATQPWRKFFTKFRNRNVIDAWAWFWRAVVVSNPAFVVSNIIDTPTKGLYFAATNRWSQKASEEAIEMLPDIRALGVENTAYFHDNGRSFLQRMGPDSYGNLDRAAAVADLFTSALAKNTLQPVERATKLRLARRIFTGMMDEIGEALVQGKTSDPRLADIMSRTNPELLKRMKGDRTMVKEFLVLETRREILRLFPTLDTAGPVERFINKLMPFISYNFKNRVLWMGEVFEHPWMLYVISEAQGALVQYNREWWESEHPGETMPEWLFHMIRIPGTDMFLDIGMFTDSARGAELLFNHDKGGGGAGIGEVLQTLIRPLPAQRAFINKAAYDMFGVGGRWRYERVFDENGLWDGKTVRQVQIPPGTPWGEKPLDYVRDYFWLPSFAEQVDSALKDGEMSYADAIRTMGTLISFGEFAEPSKYFMVIQQYFKLPTDEARAAFLETEAGQWLKEHWDQEYFKPTDTAASPFAFNYAAGPPTEDEIRKRFLMQQPPDVRERFFDGWSEAEALQEYWDEQIDGAKGQAERQRLWGLRRTSLTQFYHERPWLWQYAGMGMSEEEFEGFQGRRLIDDQRNVLFDVWGWDKAPTDPDERAAWEQERNEWIKAHPALRADLQKVKDSYERSVVERNRRWKKLISLGEANTRVKELAYDRDDQKLVDATDGLRKFISDGFNMEAFGYDKDREQYRVKADSLTSKLRRAAGDPQAVADALYAQRMEAVWEKAGDDPLKWHNIVDRNKDLKRQYFTKNPEKKLTWEQDGKYLEFWGRMGRLADKGRWDQYWDSWDAAPQWTKDRFRAGNPKKYREFVQSARYSHYMGTWVGMFDTRGPAAAMAYFHNLPEWAKERYYANHPGQSFSANGGRGFEYVSMLNRMFDQIDGGNWDAAERVWNQAPAWMRRRYYANNPDSTLFRGGGGVSGYSGGGGGIPDAKYKKYIQSMKQWTNLLRDGKESEAVKYFHNLPQWMQDFYVRNNPDKSLVKEDMKMQALLEDYFLADPAHQQEMLRNNPRLARWLNENDTQTARRNAIEYLYSRLPDDPWLKRVYREKYPEIFGDEAVGKRRREEVADTLADHPEFRGPWMEWLEGIYDTLQEAMKYMTGRPKQVEIDHTRMQRKGYRGMSAEEVSERVKKESTREWKLNKRMPMPEG
jgi:hypothetical protein